MPPNCEVFILAADRTTHEADDTGAERGPRGHDRFVELLESHQRLLLKVCWAYARSPDDRDDLFQEIVARLWSAFSRYDPNRKFSTWMYRIALNVAIDFRRRDARQVRAAVSLEDDHAAGRGERSDGQVADERLRELHELFEMQSSADRALLILYLEGHSYREMSGILGISVTNVGTRLGRLKQSLRESVQADG